MKILAFESSAKVASVALMEDGRLLSESVCNCGLTHSRTLLQMARELLDGSDTPIAAIEAVACAEGPGSFTGLRIGVAAAKGIAWGREIPCVGVSTLEAMARGIAVSDGVIAALMDARRNQYYYALFEVFGGKLSRLCLDCAATPERVRDDLRTVEKPKFLVGDGASLCYNTLNELQGVCLLPEHLRMQRAAGVALLAHERLCRGELGDAAGLSPKYLRLSQAERERLERIREQ